VTSAPRDATLAAVRAFNTEGPVVAADHYHIPPLERIDLEAVLGLVRDKKYFVLHAPRQTGKTSAPLALRDLLNGRAAADYRCVYANVEAGQAAREDVMEGMRTVLAELALQASVTLDDETLEELWPGVLERVGPGQALRRALLRWSMADPRPLVLLIDEIDALVGDTLLAVLRQLRTGYVDRPARFPHSIVLCGVRDVRDYRIHSSAEDRLVLGGSAFNIKSKSLRLGDFSEQEVRALLAQHTAATGQAFTEDALRLILARTAGQPWLVNALCREACFDDKAGRDRSRPITEQATLDAQERLILRRDTHIDDLANKLREERVRRVVEPILAGSDEVSCSAEDLAYVRDLGLVAQDAGGPPRMPHRQPDLRGSGAAPSELRRAGDASAAGGMVRGRGGHPEHGRADRGVPGVLPGALRALGAALRALPRGRAAVAAAGAPAADRQRRRAHRAGVRTGARAHGPADRVAAGWARAAFRGGVQGAARGTGADRRGGNAPDPRVHGPMRGGVGPLDRVRPRAGADLGGEDLPPRAVRRRRAGHGLGHVTS